MLSIENLTYRIGGRVLLERASLSLPAGHHAGLVGRNGTGKSTLLKLIAGELHADSGDIGLPNGTRLGMLAQEAPDGPDSLIDTVLKADCERTALLAEAEHATDPHRIADIHTRLADIQAHRAPARAAAILHGLGFDAEQQLRPCRDFSGGWRMRVALAAVLFSEPDLLLLDEPTNHLDLEATLWLEDFLRKYPRTVLLVSHDRDLLNKVVDKIVHLEMRKLTVYSGGYDTFEKTRALKLANIAAAGVLSGVDVIATPTTPTPAFPLGEKVADPLQMYLADIFTVSVNLAGLPGISIPCGFTEGSRLPIGFQVIGRMFDEATMLRVADAFERATPWWKSVATV